jgi:hypothetical protein
MTRTDITNAKILIAALRMPEPDLECVAIARFVVNGLCKLAPHLRPPKRVEAMTAMDLAALLSGFTKAAEDVINQQDAIATQVRCN